MCIYGMQSPGGYQLIGRTIPVWRNFALRNASLTDNNWLLKSFDQVQFHLVSEEELMATRLRLKIGEETLKVTDTVFKVKDYLAFLETNKTDIQTFQDKQQTAFNLERSRWDNIAEEDEEEEPPKPKEEFDVKRAVPVRSQISGNVWSVAVKAGDFVQKGDALAVVEAMKLEINVFAPQSGVVDCVFVQPGAKVNHGHGRCYFCYYLCSWFRMFST
jgi:urea carboxylase